jgi:choline dehydrogenase-like flavoprotein
VSRFGAHSGGFDLPRLRVWTVGIEAFVCAVVIVPCGAAGIRPVHSPAGPRLRGSGQRHRHRTQHFFI